MVSTGCSNQFRKQPPASSYFWGRAICGRRREGIILTSQDGREWELEESDTATNLNGIVFGAERYVAVGNSRTVLVSSNGQDWQQIEVTAGTESLQSVTFGQGLFVAVGDFGLVMTSPDASVWTVLQVGEEPPFWLDAVFCQDRFAITGTPGKVAYSQDGVQWRVQNTATDHFLYGITCSPRGDVVVGDFGTILQSPPS